MSIMENEFRILLRESLSDKFNLDELNTLCFDLNIDYEDIPGNNKQAKVVELIKYCERTDQMAQNSWQQNYWMKFRKLAVFWNEFY